MNIQVPSEEDFKRDQKKRRVQGIFGFVFGVLFFGFVGIKIFVYGFDQVTLYTWIALGFGVLSFSFLAYKFGSEFWSALFKN